MGGIDIQIEVVNFLVSMGIPVSQQEPAYQMELAYRRGYEDALKNYAIWKNSIQVVGCMERPLKDVIHESKNQDVPIRY